MTTEELIEVLKQHPGKEVLAYRTAGVMAWPRPELAKVRLRDDRQYWIFDKQGEEVVIL